jgi:hypothetical protein
MDVVFWIWVGFLIPMLTMIYGIGEQFPKFIYIVGWILLPLSLIFLCFCLSFALGDSTVSKDLFSFIPAFTPTIISGFCVYRGYVNR